MGVRLKTGGGRWYVSMITEGSPAHQAGITPGSAILSVDGTKLTEWMTEADVLAKLNGKDGSSFSLVWNSPQGKEQTTTVTRTWKDLPQLESTLSNGTLTLVVRYLGAEEVKQAKAALSQAGIQRVVLRMETLPGGDVDSLASFLGLLLPRGTSLFRLSNGKTAVSYVTKADPVYTGSVVTVTRDFALSLPGVIATKLEAEANARVQHIILEDVAGLLAPRVYLRDSAGELVFPDTYTQLSDSTGRQQYAGTLNFVPIQLSQLPDSRRQIIKSAALPDTLATLK